MTSTLIEVLKQALEALEYMGMTAERYVDNRIPEAAITAIKEALREHAMYEVQRLGQEIEQEPVAYDKTEINFFVQDLYDKKMQEGKHGHYETMFHVVHQAIKRATPPPFRPQNFCPRCGKRTNDIHTCTPPQRTWVGLTDMKRQMIINKHDGVAWETTIAIEQQLKEKNA